MSDSFSYYPLVRRGHRSRFAPLSTLSAHCCSLRLRLRDSWLCRSAPFLLFSLRLVCLPCVAVIFILSLRGYGTASILRASHRVCVGGWWSRPQVRCTPCSLRSVRRSDVNRSDCISFYTLFPSPFLRVAQKKTKSTMYFILCADRFYLFEILMQWRTCLVLRFV